MALKKLTKKEKIEIKKEDLLSKHDRAVEKGHFRRAEKILQTYKKLDKILYKAME